MEKLHFSISIKAAKEKVWHTMLDDIGYRQWAAAFYEGSYYKGDWALGSKMLFLSPEDDGMVSRIVANIPYQFISIEHLGFVSKGVEDTESAGARAFAGAHENYTFRENNGYTEVLVDTDSPEEYKGMFEDMWPKALALLKALSEGQ
ncbi:MAG TPA: SRPBCC domain-containing protein [Edaphocola sp.]|nr:SRPBCC domain-containing protein [Edaphocola sp.]